MLFAQHVKSGGTTASEENGLDILSVSGQPDIGSDIESESVSYYVYSQLTEEEQTIYRELFNGIQNMEEQFAVSSKDKEQVERIYSALLSDHPELFWVSGYTITFYAWANTIQSIEIQPDYVMSREKRDENQLLVDEKTSLILEEARRFDNEYEQAKFLYEYLIDMTEYDLNAPNNQNILSVLLTNRSVCMGYAKAYQYLAQLLGMECVTVTGEAGGESHAWNLLNMEGDYYYVDTTWGDPSFNAELDGVGNINYLYLGMNTEDLERTHEDNVWYALPECTADRCNFYIRSGLAFESFQQNTIGELIRRTKEIGEPYVTFRFLNEGAYESALEHLISENHIFDYYDGTSLNYRQDDTYWMLTIYYD